MANHLAPLVAEIGAAIAPRDDQRRFWCSVPPRHWKTSTLLGAVLTHLSAWPDRGVAYVAHSQAFAKAGARRIKQASNANLRVSGPGGDDLAGMTYRLIVLDDLIKIRRGADERARIWKWIEDDVLTRLDPDGSVSLVGSRSHYDDQIGRAIEAGWPGVNLPALSGNEDVPLLPAVWSFESLDAIRKRNPRAFQTVYQGTPTKETTEDQVRGILQDLFDCGYHHDLEEDPVGTALTKIRALMTPASAE